jgi:hypothetical protein
MFIVFSAIFLEGCEDKFTTRETLMRTRADILDAYLCSQIKSEAEAVLYENNSSVYRSVTYYPGFLNALNLSAQKYWNEHFLEFLPKDTPQAILQDFATLRKIEVPHIEELSCRDLVSDFYQNLDYRSANDAVQLSFWQKLKRFYHKY